MSITIQVGPTRFAEISVVPDGLVAVHTAYDPGVHLLRIEHGPMKLLGSVRCINDFSGVNTRYEGEYLVPWDGNPAVFPVWQPGVLVPEQFAAFAPSQEYVSHVLVLGWLRGHVHVGPLDQENHLALLFPVSFQVTRV